VILDFKLPYFLFLVYLWEYISKFCAMLGAESEVKYISRVSRLTGKFNH
jgi:hypothetical protein